MKARDLASVALKTLGIYWLVEALLLLVRGAMMPFMGLQNVQGYNWKLEMASVLLFVALYAVAGYFLILRTASVLRLIGVEKTIADSIASDDPKQNYGPLAFSLLGAYFAIPAFGYVISGLIKLASQWQEASANYGMFKQAILMNILPDLTGNIAELIIGMALILGRERLAQVWKRLRPLAEKENGEK